MAVTKTNNYPNPFDYDFCSYRKGGQVKINYVTNLLFSSLTIYEQFADQDLSLLPHPEYPPATLKSKLRHWKYSMTMEWDCVLQRLVQQQSCQSSRVVDTCRFLLYVNHVIQIGKWCNSHEITKFWHCPESELV